MDTAAKPSYVPCNLCSADDCETVFEAGRAQVNRIVKCRSCGLMYSNPRTRPVDHELVSDFDPAQTSNAESYNPRRFAKERMQVRDYDGTRKTLRSLFPDRGTLVEMGCGMGFLLKAFNEDGWKTIGIEPDRGFCQFIRREQGLIAIPKILEESGLPENSADVVVFLHVIEHVPDPLATLRAIYRVLKPGGLLIMETPRYDSFMFKILRHRERSVSCDGHIYFFTTETLKKLSVKAGFSHVQTRYVGRTIDIGRLAWNVGVMLRTPAIGRAFAKLGLNDRTFRLNARDMQRVIYRKP